MVTETWLTNAIPDEALHIPGFIITRKDRPTRRGGGVAIYIRESIPFKIRVDLCNLDYECLWITIRPKWLPRKISKLALACVYLPPSMNIEAVESFYEYCCYSYDILISGSPSTSIIIARDFNPISNGFQERVLINHCKLKQVIKSPTRGMAILDLILTNAHSFYQAPVSLAPIGCSDHNSIIWKSKEHVQSKNSIKKITVRPIKETRLRLFEECIGLETWSAVYDAPCINAKVDAFLSITNIMIDYCFPTKIVKVHKDDKPFITGKIKQMISNRNKAYQRGKTAEYRSLRNRIILEIRKEKQKYYSEKIKPVRCSDSKQWWKNIKNIIGKSNHEFILSNPQSNVPLNSKETANLMNEYFTSLTSNYSEVRDSWFDVGTEEELPNVTADSVAKKLSKLNPNKASGPFDPSVKLIKTFAKYFAEPLSYIFNESFTCRTFPDIWKISRVCGIPKSKPCTTVDLLRPISLTSTLSKVQESYVNDWIYEDVYDKISSSQFGGLPGSSTIHALIYLLHKWYMAMESPNKIVRIMFLDFRKAFDLIDHNLLLEDFMQIGVRPAAVGWFASYLHNRSQATSFQGVQSECKRIKGGIPQGSKLGPIAFIIKINQLPMCIVRGDQDQICKSLEDQDVAMFMDDTTLSEVINVSDHLDGNPIGNTQINVDRVVKFANDEGMELNCKKCMEMIIDFRKNVSFIPPIHIGGHNVTRTKSYKLLGIWLDDDFKWKTNTEYVTKKAAKRLYFLKILKSYGAPADDLLAFYCSVIRPVLEYGAEIWNGGLTQEQRKRIERIQKRAFRIIYPKQHYDQVLKEKKLQTLEERRDHLCISLIKKMLEPNHKLHNLLPRKVEYIRQKETRSNNQRLYNFSCKSERFKHSPLVYSIYLYNSKLVD